MSQALSPSTGMRYGLARTCRVWQVARSTLDWRRQDPAESRRRPGPKGPGSDDVVVGHMRTILQDSPFHGEGYRKVWARLRYRYIRTSPRRVLRGMRAHAVLVPGRRGNPHGPKAHDGTIMPDGLDLTFRTPYTTIQRIFADGILVSQRP